MRQSVGSMLCVVILAGSGCVVDQNWRFDGLEELTVRVRWHASLDASVADSGCASIVDAAVEIPDRLPLRWSPVPGPTGGACAAMDDVDCGCEAVLGPVRIEDVVTVVDDVARLIPAPLARLVTPGVEVRGTGVGWTVHVVSGGRLGTADPVAARLDASTIRWTIEGAEVLGPVRAPVQVSRGGHLRYEDSIGRWLAGDPRRWVLAPGGR